MKRILNGSNLKLGFAALSGGLAVAAGYTYKERKKNSAPVTSLVKKHFVSAQGLTHSVLDPKFSRAPIPWDDNWDKRDPESLVKPLKSDASDKEKQSRADKVLQNTARAKRIIVLVRHGQYNDRGANDASRYLTELGREQADITGKRLEEMYRHLRSKSGTDENENEKEIGLKFTQSTMTRATETAQIILKHFPEYSAENCDLIREGAPCEPVPSISPLLWNPSPSAFFEDGARIEAGFRKYFHRADPEQMNDSVDIIVCHANVIRYFVCRALQLPPEAWLRFSLHNGSFTVMSIQPNGRVSLSILGEAGHFPVEKMTVN